MRDVILLILKQNLIVVFRHFFWSPASSDVDFTKSWSPVSTFPYFREECMQRAETRCFSYYSSEMTIPTACKNKTHYFWTQKFIPHLWQEGNSSWLKEDEEESRPHLPSETSKPHGSNLHTLKTQLSHVIQCYQWQMSLPRKLQNCLSQLPEVPSNLKINPNYKVR